MISNNPFEMIQKMISNKIDNVKKQILTGEISVSNDSTMDSKSVHNMRRIKAHLEHKLSNIINEVSFHHGEKHHHLEKTKKFKLKRETNIVISPKINNNKTIGFHYIKLSTLSDRIKRPLTSFHLQSSLINNANKYHSKFTALPKLLSFSRNSQREVTTMRKPIRVLNLKKKPSFVILSSKKVKLINSSILRKVSLNY